VGYSMSIDSRAMRMLPVNREINRVLKDLLYRNAAIVGHPPLCFINMRRLMCGNRKRRLEGIWARAWYWVGVEKGYIAEYFKLVPWLLRIQKRSASRLHCDLSFMSLSVTLLNLSRTFVCPSIFHPII
jgi:hypothetical protein